MTRQEIKERLRGIFLPVVTPFDRHGRIDETRFRENLLLYREAGLAGIVVAGSTGEAPYLTERGRLRLVEAARQVIPPPQPLIARTGPESTPENLRPSREAAARRAGAAL